MEMVVKMKLGGGIKILGGELNDKGEASRLGEEAIHNVEKNCIWKESSEAVGLIKSI